MSETMPFGNLIVKVSTANGAIPVEAVTVVIQGKEESNSDILLSLLTDISGETSIVSLPSPAKDLSTAPFPTSKPYYTYNIDIYKAGYYPQHYNGVPIFEGVTAIQNAFIIPTAEFDAQTPHYTPGQTFDEYENPYL